MTYITNDGFKKYYTVYIHDPNQVGDFCFRPFCLQLRSAAADGFQERLFGQVRPDATYLGQN